jgi:hypothetical protein
LGGEVPDIDALTSEARQTMGFTTDDSGKQLVARYIARRLTGMTPTIVPPSIKRILDRAIEVTWRQSCLKRETSMEMS